MQIYLKFKGENIILPISHQYYVQSLIYNMVSSDEKFSEFVHNSGDALGNRRFKAFTFGKLAGRYEVKDKQISYKDGFTLQIRSPKPEFTDAVLRTLESERNYTLCDCKLELEDYRVENRIITDNEIKIKTLSPIVVHTTSEDKKIRYFSPLDYEFYQAIVSNAISKYMVEFNEIPGCNFYILPECDFTERSKTVTRYKGIYITGWNGVFTLKSNPKVLDFLYNTGLGVKNAQGFGMFERWENIER